MSTIVETCDCGATITVTMQYGAVARNAVAQWREGHKHAESVGICGDMPPFMLGNPPQFPTCELKFGHTGAHSGVLRGRGRAALATGRSRRSRLPRSRPVTADQPCSACPFAGCACRFQNGEGR